MKKKYFIFTVFAIFSISLRAQDYPPDKQFYYYNGEKFYLQVDYSRISVISDGKFNVDNAKKLVNSSTFRIKTEGRSYTRLNVVPVDEISKAMQNKEIFIAEIEFPEPLKQADYYEIIRQLSKEDSVIKIFPTHTVSDKGMGISNNFYVKLFKEEDRNKLFELAEKYSIQVLGYNEFMPLWFTLSCSRESPLDVIDAANLFFEMGLFECAEPEFLCQNLLTPSDEYFSEQWGLKNTGQFCNASGIDIRAEDAWSLTKGATSIRIAIFDQGIKVDHPDLEDNIYGTGYDATTSRSPAQLRNFHGTLCAGVVGARQNNFIGISGVAPNSKLISISSEIETDTPQQMANGFNWACGKADVISCSWGSSVPSGIIDNAITNILSQGRNGKGTVVVFAAGNDNNTNIMYPGKNNPDILVVGGIAPDGERKSRTSCDNEVSWPGSSYGAQLDIVAPGAHIRTTTWTGDYTSIGGTSLACPHVAGVAALVLSVNPNLTGQQVRDIIESTAQKTRTDLYTYSPTSGRTNGTWNNEMGYGLVDAHAAVLAAQATLPLITILGPEVVSPSATYTLSNGSAAWWTVTDGFAVTSSRATSTITVSTSHINGRSGTLTATTTGGSTFTKAIQSCEASISGSSSICTKGSGGKPAVFISLPHTLTGIPPGLTVSNTSWSSSQSLSLSSPTTQSVVVSNGGIMPYIYAGYPFPPIELIPPDTLRATVTINGVNSVLTKEISRAYPAGTIIGPMDIGGTTIVQPTASGFYKFSIDPNVFYSNVTWVAAPVNNSDPNATASTYTGGTATIYLYDGLNEIRMQYEDLCTISNPAVLQVEVNNPVPSLVMNPANSTTTALSGNELKVKLSPNPVTNYLNIAVEDATQPIQVAVYSSSGTMYLLHTFSTSIFTVDLSRCQPGVLVVRISCGDKYVIKNIIKQ